MREDPELDNYALFYRDQASRNPFYVSQLASYLSLRDERFSRMYFCKRHICNVSPPLKRAFYGLGSPPEQFLSHGVLDRAAHA